MKRRSFFKSAAIGSGLAMVTPLSACERTLNTSTESINPEFELNEETVSSLQNKMKKGELTSKYIVQKYLERIEEIDGVLKAMIEINPDAEKIAEQLDQERANKGPRGMLHGIPVVIKDNIDTGDKMQTTAGSLALKGHKAKEDAFIVQKLREAGAVLLGKTNLSEWANIRSTNSSSGWSGRGGQVRNPYVLDRTPCGSSSGTGAAVAANMCTIGIGTETDGSIVCPSGTNGIVGFKPTLGSWSRHGIIPISHSQDTAGPMARTVTDAVILLEALRAPHAYDKATLASEIPEDHNYTKYLKEDGLQGKSLGIVRANFGFNAKVDAQLEAAIDVLKNAGAVVIDDVSLEGQQEWGQYEWQVLLYELKHDMNQYLREHPGAPVKSLAEIIEFNKRNKAIEMPWFNQEIFEMAEAKGDLSEKEYREALQKSKQLSQDGINGAMKKYKLDALVGPTNGPAWSIDWVNGDHFSGGSSAAAAIAGYPNITVPAGFVHELPVGLSFFGRAWSEPILIEIAYAFEKAASFRQPPKFISSLLNV